MGGWLGEPSRPIGGARPDSTGAFSGPRSTVYAEVRAALSLRLVLAVCTALLVAVPCAAQGAGFSHSSLAPLGDPLIEGDTFRYVLTLRNEGDDASAIVDIDIPSSAMFVGIEGLTGATFDAEARRVNWQGSVPARSTGVVTLSLLARADTGGHTVSIRATVRPWQGDALSLSHVAAVDGRPAPAVFSLGRVGVSVAGVVVLGWLLAAGVFWLVLRAVRPAAATWAPIAILLPLAFLGYFGWLAYEDVRIAALPTQPCTVLDRLLDASSSSSSSSTSSRSRTVYKPRLAVRYVQDGVTRVAQGFGTDSRLSSGRAASADALLETYAIGATVPCAIDSQDPRRAYVERGPGGAYILALIPLPLLGLGVWGLASTKRRRR
jgi:hypothetical protein